MVDAKRRRGRPAGEGKKDAPYIAQVANLLVTDQSLKTPTAAMWRVIKSRSHWEASDETLLRRWQGKWAKDKSTFMAEARKRNAPSPSPTGPQSHTLLATDPFGLKAYQVMGKFLESPAHKAMQDYANSPAHRKMLPLINSPSYQAQLTQMSKFAQMMQEDPFQEKIRLLQKIAGTIFGSQLLGRRIP